MNVQFLIGPAVGALIGGITNGIAIKMLFRPINPVKVGNITLPFTPGVIPKEKNRIATKIGTVISSELLNEEVLKQWLIKDEISEEIRKSVKKYLEKHLENDQTVNDKLAQLIGEERSTFVVCEAEEFLTEKIYSKLVKMELGKVITDKLVQAYKEGAFGSLLGPMSFFVNDNLVLSLAGKLEPFITGFIENEGEPIIRQAVEDESKKLLATPVKEYAEKISSFQEVIAKTIENCYVRIVEEHLGKILKKLDIAKIIEERILELDMLELEKIILSIMKKELNAIIWFGVILGAIMGLIASLF